MYAQARFSDNYLGYIIKLKELNLAKNILIIDDEREFCSLMTEFLTEEGYSVDVAYNGEEGIAKVDSFKPDLILLDIKMPVLGGIEAFKIIKEKSNTPIIIITGSSANDIKEQCDSLGCCHFIPKPINLDEIQEKIESILNG